jgi:hypothetical protein
MDDTGVLPNLKFDTRFMDDTGVLPNHKIETHFT